MDRTNLILGLALCTSLTLNIFSEEVKALPNIVSLSIFTAVVTIIVVLISEDIEKLWAKICGMIQNVKRGIKLLVAWAFSVNDMIKFLKESWDRYLQFAVEASETIRRLEQEAHAKVKTFVVYLAIEAEGMIRSGGAFLTDRFRAFVKWVKSIFQEKDSPPNDPSPEEWRKRVLFIVSLPYEKSYQAIKEVVGEQNPSRAFIDWETDEIRSIPSILNLPSFVRHFAVCLVPLDVWADRTKSLVQKFQDGTYWELIGPDPVLMEGDCVGWTEEKIRNIDSIMEVGITTYSNDTISQDLYGPLRAAWAYYNTIWWNCFDFAVRLACLTLCEDIVKEQLKEVREKIERLRSLEVMRAEEELAIRGFDFGCKGFVGSWFGCLGAIILLPAVPVALSALGFLFCGAGMTSGAYGAWLQSRTEHGFMHKWRELSKELEKKFPRLEGLIDWEEGKE